MRGLVPPIQVYIHIGSHTLGEISVNHFNQPYRGTGKVLGLVSHDYQNRVKEAV